MTTDPYGDAGSATYGPGGQAPVAPGYGISDPFPGTYGDDTGATAVGGTGGGSSTTETAKSEAGQVKDTAKAEAGQVAGTAKAEAGQVAGTAAGAAQQVAGTAKEEASNVVGEAKAQATNLLDQVRGEAGSQVVSQKDRLADLAHSYAKQLGSMASGSPESGPVTDLVQDLSARLGGAGHWLQNHEPADVLEEVRRFARRRPGAFLLSALAAGVVVGRLTRGAVDEHRAESGASSVGTPELTTGAAYSTPGQGTYADQPLGYADPVSTGYTQPVSTGYAEPVAGYGAQTNDQTYVQGSGLTDPYGSGSTYGTNPGDVR